MVTQNDIKTDMDKVISKLEAENINFRTNEDDVIGLGDVVESTLEYFGVTEERFKAFFNLKECNCSKRKKWLNNLFTIHRKNKKNGG